VHLHLGNATAALEDYQRGATVARDAHLVAPQRDMLKGAVQLLYGLGQAATAEPVWAELEGACRALGDDAGLQQALGERALLVLGRMDLDGAAPLFDEQEQICRALGDQNALASCVGNRAILLRHRGDMEGALRCLDEQAQLSRSANNAQGVLFATANRGEVLGLMGRKDEALAALNDARNMASQWGVTAMLAQLDQLIAQFQ
jgi:tetratricopeptide (TPR) repeat protein